MKPLIILLASAVAVSAQWPAPKAPAVPEADGYVEIPNVTLAPTKNSTYRAVFDATRPADKPTTLLPALNMAGSELNALATVNAPLRNAKFAIVFHGPAVDGILDDEHYRAKFGTTNPNLKPIAKMKKHGVEFFCQWTVPGRRENRSENFNTRRTIGGRRVARADAISEQRLCFDELLR